MNQYGPSEETITFENPTVAAEISRVQVERAVPEEIADVVADLESLSDEEVPHARSKKLQSLAFKGLGVMPK